MIKLIASDMDGTLLNSKKELPSNFDTTYKKLQQSGIHFIISSGRQLYTLENEFKHINHKLLFIAENGAIIKNGANEIVLNSHSSSDIRTLINEIRAIKDAFPIVCAQNFAYFEDDDSEFIQEVNKYYLRNKKVEDLTALNDTFLKIAIFDKTGPNNNSYKILSKFKDQYQLVISSEVWLDIMPIGTNKGKGIEYFQNQLNVTSDETMVFGDYLNDLEMMDHAYYSYAMENAHPTLKVKARFKSASNDDNGVMKTIEEKLFSEAPIH